MAAPAVTITPDQAAPPAVTITPDPAPEGAALRFGKNFLSGLGVTSDEQAKSFFAHPLDSVIKSLEAQGQLAIKARDAYEKGDYMGALQHALNYLIPFIGQQTDQAGEQLKAGDIGGGIGRTLGTAVPIIASSPEVQSAASEAAGATAATGARAVRAAARGANTAMEKAPGSVGAAAGAAVGRATGIPGATEIGSAAGYAFGKEVLPQIRIPGEGFGFPSRVTGGPVTIQPDVEVPTEPPAAESAAAGSIAEPVAASASPSGGAIPRTLSGDSALREVLVSEPNKTLLQIARSRGIDVTPEAQLKPTNAVNNRIINKIIDDFSPDELEEIRAQHLEATRMGPNDFRGAIGKEANQTINLQTYFPELKIPLSRILRTQKAVQAAKAPVFGAITDLAKTLETPTPTETPDLVNILKESVKRAQQKKVAAQ